jgi:hypothetical protein
VGLDGYTSTTVEQIGTDSDCSDPVTLAPLKAPLYVAWYEFYPAPPVFLPTKGAGAFTIKPGDTISASAYCLDPTTMPLPCTAFTVGISVVAGAKKDVGQSFSIMGAPAGGGMLSSAECIAEAPSGIPLTDFGTVKFGVGNTGVSGTCYATLLTPVPCGPTPLPPCMSMLAPFGFFGPIAITMVSDYAILPRNCGPGFVKAMPGALGADGASFTITWSCAGP